MNDAPKKGWLSRLTEGLSRSSKQMTEQVVATFIKEPLSEAALEGLEEHLLESDLGPAATDRIVARFRELRFGAGANEREVKEALAEAVAAELINHEARYEPLNGARPFVTLFVGVNGSGKTTTLGKIAADLTGQGAKVMIVACDTFRAAAREQLKIWAERAGATFESRRDGADPAGLAFDAYTKAKAEGYDVVLIDTAGRLQNKTALMDELLKIVRVLKKIDPEAPHETLLVLDATVGPQRPGAGTDFRPHGLCLRTGHDQAGRHGARRGSGARRPGLGRPDKADRRRRRHRRPATLRRASLFKIAGGA